MAAGADDVAMNGRTGSTDFRDYQCFLIYNKFKGDKVVVDGLPDLEASAN